MIYLNSYKTWIFIGYTLLVVCFSLSSDIQIKIFPNLWKYDKIVHFIEYFGLGFLFVNMLSIQPLIRKTLVYSLFFILLFPLFDESLQYFTPNRIPDIYDVFADFCGGTMGSLLRYYFK